MKYIILLLVVLLPGCGVPMTNDDIIKEAN